MCMMENKCINGFLIQAAEGARISGASRIIGVDLNSSRFEEGEIYNS